MPKRFTHSYLTLKTLITKNMEELEFRIWIPKQNRMTPVAGLCFTHKGLQIEVPKAGFEDKKEDWENLNNLEFWWEHEIVLMQFTGLKDKNGTKIFQGYILKGFLDKLCIVKFGDYMVNGMDYYSNYATAGFYIEYFEEYTETSYIKEDEVTKVGDFCLNPELFKKFPVNY